MLYRIVLLWFLRNRDRWWRRRWSKPMSVRQLQLA